MTSLLLWHLGRAGAGAKFTHDYVTSLGELGRPPAATVAVDGSELAAICGGCLRTVPRLPGRGEASGNGVALRGWLGALRLPDAFARLLDEVRPDVAVCTFQTVWDVALVPLLRWRGIRYVLVLHDSWFRTGDAYPLRSWSLARQISAADGIVVLTDYAAREVAREFGLEPSRIATIPHPAFVFGKAAEEPRRRTEGPLRLLFLGRLIAYKGLDILIETYRELRARGRDVRLEVAGAGELGTLERELTELDGVTLIHRWLDEVEMAAALARNDVVVLPYREATQSGIAAAAFAAAMPVVATPVGGLVEQVGRAGAVLSRATTAAALADAISPLTDFERYHAISSAVLRHARTELSWTAAARHLAEFCDRTAVAPACSARPALVEVAS